MCVFFFKQKTAYDMRISDWSSDVCSSDLRDYNPLVIANLEDADRLIAFVVHKPTFVPARLKPVIYADALRHRDLLDKIFWIIADEMEQKPLNDELGKVRVPTLILWGRHAKLIDVDRKSTSLNSRH